MVISVSVFNNPSYILNVSVKTLLAINPQGIAYPSGSKVVVPSNAVSGVFISLFLVTGSQSLRSETSDPCS